jgi:hypothetical protein
VTGALYEGLSIDLVLRHHVDEAVLELELLDAEVWLEERAPYVRTLAVQVPDNQWGAILNRAVERLLSLCTALSHLKFSVLGRYSFFDIVALLLSRKTKSSYWNHPVRWFTLCGWVFNHFSADE